MIGAERGVPRRAKHPCNHHGCHALTFGRYCPTHDPGAWADKRTTERRVIGGRALQTARARLFNEHPLCVECERQGRVSAAEYRDHVVPLAEGGTDTEENTQGLCKACHEAKSEAERRRGVAGRQG